MEIPHSGGGGQLLVGAGTAAAALRSTTQHLAGSVFFAFLRFTMHNIVGNRT